MLLDGRYSVIFFLLNFQNARGVPSELLADEFLITVTSQPNGATTQ